MQDEIEVTGEGMKWQAAASRARRDARHTYLTENGLRVAVVAPLTLNGTAAPDGLLNESQRWQVEEARDCLGTWDLARDGNPGIDRERVLADQLRAVLAVIDDVAPKAGDQ